MRAARFTAPATPLDPSPPIACCAGAGCSRPSPPLDDRALSACALRGRLGEGFLVREGESEMEGLRACLRP